MWQRQLALAGDGWRVVAPQLRGFDGGTADPPAAAIDDYAGDVIDLLDALHVDEAVIGGLSMGGYIAFAVLLYFSIQLSIVGRAVRTLAQEVAMLRGEPIWHTSSTGPMSMPSSSDAVATSARRSPARRRVSTR